MLAGIPSTLAAGATSTPCGHVARGAAERRRGRKPPPPRLLGSQFNGCGYYRCIASVRFRSLSTSRLPPIA
jgi:hypothetical protein